MDEMDEGSQQHSQEMKMEEAGGPGDFSNFPQIQPKTIENLKK